MTLRCQKLLAQVSLSISPDTRVGDLGLGQQQLVEIAKALNKQVRLLILDEPTASLTEQETSVLLDIIRDLTTARYRLYLYFAQTQRSQSDFRYDLRYSRRTAHWYA